MIEPPKFTQVVPLHKARQDFDRQYVPFAFERCGRDVQRTARALKIGESLLRHILARLGIE